MTGTPAHVPFRCACGNPLSAPSDWRARSLRCPACAAAVTVPDAPDPDAAAALDLARAARSPVAPVPPDAPAAAALRAPGPHVELDFVGAPADDGTPPPVAPAEFASRIVRAGRRRRRIVAGAVLGVLAVLIGLGLYWRHVYHRDYSAAGRMAKRGFGERLSAPGGPGEPTVLDRVHEAERRFDGARTRETARELVARFEEALDGRRLPRRWEAHVSNNFAWFLVTSPFPELRDAPRSLDLARRAVDLTGGADAAYLDTLAEAFFALGRVPEAIETEERAAAADPSADFTGPQLERFRHALPPEAPAP